MTKAAQAKTWSLYSWGDGRHSSAPESTAFATDFSVDENPISQGGIWVRGLAEGGNWNNVRTNTGRATAAVASDQGGSRYDDSLAHLSTSYRTFNANQYAEAVVYRANGYNGPNHEIELLLRFAITSGNARGYEVLWSSLGNIAIVRWNGALGNYTALYDPGAGSVPVPADGDVLRAQIVGNSISVYRNSSLVVSGITDNTWATGQPGIGFWPVDGSNPDNLGWTSFTADNI